jgi:dihydrofolate reductase
MSNVVAFVSLSLDGVMQAPARPDEDRRGGFEHGGWALPYAWMGAGMDRTGNTGALLLGRRTYEDFYSVWPNRTDGNPFTEILNNKQKYVASTTLKEPLPWMNSTLLVGDAADAVAQLKQEQEKDLLILGSGVLVQSLMRRNLLDRFVLLIHPLVLGSGSHLFTDGGPYVALTLANTTTTPTGVVIATYQRADSPAEN